MKFSLLVCLFISFTTIQARAESLKKPYFAKTPVGSWAKYQSDWTKPDGMKGSNLYTYIRASDNAGRIALEMDIETLSGPGKGMLNWQLNIMEPGFDLATNFLNHTMFVETGVVQTKGGKAALTQPKVLEIIRKSAGDLSNSVEFKGNAEVLKRSCDHYAYSYKSGGPHVTIHEGEIWLDQNLPFGLVLQKGKVMDLSGKQLSSFEQKLIDSGSGRKATASLLAMVPKPKNVTATEAIPKAVVSLSLLEAYQNGTIYLLVEVKKGSGGKHLMLGAMNKTGDPLELVVAKGPLTLTGDSPVKELRLVFSKEQRLSLPAKGTSATFSAEQLGGRGAIEGKFKLSVYKGQPLFSGSVKIGAMR